MLRIRAPSRKAIADFLSAQEKLPLTYAPEEMTRGSPQPGYKIDHLRRRLGSGPDVFERAVAALRSWTMFRQGWVRLDAGGRPPESGLVVAIVVRIGPMWWANACRIVYLVDDAAPVRRVGFAYGTLPGHAERGEERFTVELDADDSVWYEVLAYSRPRHLLARLGYPLTRAMQQRFAIGSAAAMERAVAEKQS